MRKGYKVDTMRREVMEVSIGEDYKDIYPLIDCTTFACVDVNRNNTLFVDDEGLFKDHRRFFVLNGYPQPLCGDALLLGCDPDTGETTKTPELSFVEFREMVQFV